MKAMTKTDVLHLFHKIDAELEKQQQKAEITVLGGTAIILQDFRDRSTLDIDIAPTADAPLFNQICKKLKIPVDIITIASTVDLVHADTATQFSGKFLVVNSILAEDLIKLKLERFRKQDPEDIISIINIIELPYISFKEMIIDMLVDFIGNPKSVILSAQEIVERLYNDKLEDFIKDVATH